MGRNKFGGNKHKRYARDREMTQKTDIKHLKKEVDQEYAFVKEKLGNCRMRVSCFDKKVRLATIRGKMRRRCWINPADIVLISLRDFQDDKCDIIQKFTGDQVKLLVKNKLITESFIKDGNPFENYEYDPDADSELEAEVEGMGSSCGTTKEAASSAFTMDDFMAFSDSVRDSTKEEAEELCMEDL